MSNIGNKETMSKNLKSYIEISGKTQIEIAEAIGVSKSTFSAWVTGVKYPRIDKIELLAEYFNIRKSDLIEEQDYKKMSKSEFQYRCLLDCLPEDNTDLDYILNSVSKMDNKHLKLVKHYLEALNGNI